MFSLPSASRRIRICHLAVNTLLLLAAVEFVTHPFFDPAREVVFTRVGAVYPDSVRIVVRYPERNALESHVRVLWREYKDRAALEEGWRDGPVLTLMEKDDWVSTINLRSLWPSTTYQCESARVVVCFDQQVIQTDYHPSTGRFSRIPLPQFLSAHSLIHDCRPVPISALWSRPA
jgi:hypothetical protein